MNKFFVFIIAFFALSQVSYAQDKVFAKGDKVVSAGLGFVNTRYTGNGWRNTFPPISFTGEYGIVDGLIDGKASIGVGAELGFAGVKYVDIATYKYSVTKLGARGAFHYQFIDKLDTYAGLFLGYDIVSGNGIHAISEYDYDFYIGARYRFTNDFAFMAEIGSSISLFSIGVAYKF
ncbi:MAG: hypothetical protein LBQ01_00530 [Prevotellaceae bacterium]|jgi:hypothetical protein|nr:hypothetical protein [Prevotellaceae bacterium]